MYERTLESGGATDARLADTARIPALDDTLSQTDEGVCDGGTADERVGMEDEKVLRVVDDDGGGGVAVAPRQELEIGGAEKDANYVASSGGGRVRRKPRVSEEKVDFRTGDGSRNGLEVERAVIGGRGGQDKKARRGGGACADDGRGQNTG